MMQSELLWPIIRVAYLWFWHLLLLSTVYKGQKKIAMRMNGFAVLLTPLPFIPAISLPGLSSITIEIIGMTMIAVTYFLTLKSKTALGYENWDNPRSKNLPKEIVASGPYSRIRHPLYLAMMTGTGGQFMLTGTWLFIPLTLAFIVLAYRNAKHDEQKLLSSELALAYEAYAKKVRYRFIPFLV